MDSFVISPLLNMKKYFGWRKESLNWFCSYSDINIQQLIDGNYFQSLVSCQVIMRFEWKLLTQFDTALIPFLWPQLMTTVTCYAKKVNYHSNGRLLEVGFPSGILIDSLLSALNV